MPTARRLVLSEPAERDLDHYWTTIASSNGETVAEEQVRSLLATAERIASFPDMGRRRFSLGADLWSFPTRSHIVFYRAEGDAVTIVRFIPARMDIEEEMLTFLNKHFGPSD